MGVISATATDEGQRTKLIAARDRNGPKPILGRVSCVRTAGKGDQQRVRVAADVAARGIDRARHQLIRGGVPVGVDSGRKVDLVRPADGSRGSGNRDQHRAAHRRGIRLDARPGDFGGTVLASTVHREREGLIGQLRAHIGTATKDSDGVTLRGGRGVGGLHVEKNRVGLVHRHRAEVELPRAAAAELENRAAERIHFNPEIRVGARVVVHDLVRSVGAKHIRRDIDIQDRIGSPRDGQGLGLAGQNENAQGAENSSV